MSEKLSTMIGKKVTIKGHFDEPVILEEARSLGDDSMCYECRVRLSNGTLDETITYLDDIVLYGTENIHTRPADADNLRLLIESIRIGLAYTYDRQFAVSLSGIRAFPHQIEAVYGKMLPQPRLRFLLADDPGAGKTIMTGLLIKELGLREAIDRCLILVPAALTIQWQDELKRFFDEQFVIINSASDSQALNLWERESKIISSMDYAKQDNVRERVWQQHWDLVVIDEAHKCSAYTKHSRQGDDVGKTKRYQLAEKLSERCDSLLLLTATPHHGDKDRFAHFIRLLDKDLFLSPHRFSEMSDNVRREIIQLGENNPWSLRRLKEDLKDMNGQRLFPDRHVQTVDFNLNAEEYDIYKAVTDYINKYLSLATGARKNSVALARTVFQRRLASSTHAIHESLCRRKNKQSALFHKLEALPPSEMARELARLQGRLADKEQDEDDLDEEDRDNVSNDATAAEGLDQIRAEIDALSELISRVERVKESGRDSKLVALRKCLQQSEFNELKDGRGKLLIFTEHRDTLDYLHRNLCDSGYSVCDIYGQMKPHERKKAQEDFQTRAQICVATEAAGEGINLQFCHLMINYDLPWNPTRLEQRLGRIHRIGQTRDVYAFNFVATSSDDGKPVIEGLILERLLSKLDRMKDVLGDRVFDVIGQVLSLNDINLPAILSDVAHDPRRLDDYLDSIEQIDPDSLKRYDDLTGIALARSHVDFPSLTQKNLEVEERRLMPRYIEQYFLDAARHVGIKVEQRADGLWRLAPVPSSLKSERLNAVRRFGKPETEYRKITFYKKDLDQDRHLDAVLLGPGHILYNVVDELLHESLEELLGQTAIYQDPMTAVPYNIHFYEVAVSGQTATGTATTIKSELVCVREESDKSINSERYKLYLTDALIDLPSHPHPPEALSIIDHGSVSDWIKSNVQMKMRSEAKLERDHYANITRDYLTKSFDVRVQDAMNRVMRLRSRELEEPEVSIARTRAEQDLSNLQREREERLEGIKRLQIAKAGTVRHIATCLVLPPSVSGAPEPGMLDPGIKRRVELAAEDIVIAYEEANGRECERVGHCNLGFDIRSIHQDKKAGYWDTIIDVRRIEVKGRKRGEPVRLTENEWRRAQSLGNTYWLYVVWDPLNNPDALPKRINNPAKYLEHVANEVVASRYYDISAKAIEKVAHQQEMST